MCAFACTIAVAIVVVQLTIITLHYTVHNHIAIEQTNKQTFKISSCVWYNVLYSLFCWTWWNMKFLLLLLLLLLWFFLPGLPYPHGLSHRGSPGFDFFHSAKSFGDNLTSPVAANDPSPSFNSFASPTDHGSYYNEYKV